MPEGPPRTSSVTGVFTVNAGAARDVEMVVDGLALEQVAQVIYEQAEGISLCHQCAHEMSDPEFGDLTQITVDERTYVPDGAGGWHLYSPESEAEGADRG